MKNTYDFLVSLILKKPHQKSKNLTQNMTEFFKNYNGDLEQKLELKNKINLAFTELKEWQKYRLLEMSLLYLDELKKIGYLENLNEEEIKSEATEISKRTFYQDVNLYPQKYQDLFENQKENISYFEWI